MAEKKRWIAMYTKHIKQKRKVYHDGFLDLQITRRKVMLYDEAENLLESRMLKADEVVSSGESLTFQAYLVDIGDPKDGNKPSSDPEVQPSDQGCVRKPFAALRPSFKKSSLHCEERKPNLMNKFPSQSLSPSHKMIRVFKKRELHKYGALSPDNVKPTTTGKPKSEIQTERKCLPVGFAHAVTNSKSAGTLPLGSANKGSNNHPFINSPCDDIRRENDKLSKDIPPHKPLRDVNQILSILQRPNVTETCADNNLKASMLSTKIPPESDISKNDKMEPVSSRVTGTSKNSLPQQFMVRETSTASTSVCSTTHLDDPPSFELGI